MIKTIKRPKNKTPDDCATMWQPHSGCTCSGHNKCKEQFDMYLPNNEELRKIIKRVVAGLPEMWVSGLANAISKRIRE